MGQTLSVPLGADRAWEIVARDSNGVPYTLFQASDPFEANVWAGDDIEPLFHPALSWLDAAAGRTRLDVAATDTADLTPGLYRLEVFVTPPGKRHQIFDGSLELEETAGTATALTAYCSYDDMLSYASQLPKLAGEAAQAQFAEERHNARVNFERWILNRYRPQPGRARRTVDEAGVTAGPYSRFADPPGPVPTGAEIRGYLAADKLLLTEDIIQINALLAASYVYKTSPGTANVYQQLGQLAEQDARTIFRRAVIEFDADADGDPEIRIDRDVTFLT